MNTLQENTNFNSSMVRLKEQTKFNNINIDKFQFQYGTIKREYYL